MLSAVIESKSIHQISFCWQPRLVTQYLQAEKEMSCIVDKMLSKCVWLIQMMLYFRSSFLHMDLIQNHGGSLQI